MEHYKNYFSRVLNSNEQLINLFYSVRQDNNTEWIEFIESNSKNEKMTIKLCHCESYGKKSLPYIWHKKGYTDKELNKYLTCRTYVEGINKPMLEKYNPQIEDAKINFEWLLEDTKENKLTLINEIARRFYKEA